MNCGTLTGMNIKFWYRLKYNLGYTYINKASVKVLQRIVVITTGIYNSFSLPKVY